MNARHNEMIQSQVQLVRGGLLLAGVVSGKAAAQWFLIDSYAAARRLARQQFDIQNAWLDLREGLAARIDDSCFDFDAADAVLGDLLYSNLKSRKLIDKVGGDVEGDFLNIVKDHGNNSVHHDFWQSLWSAYQTGGWPCGWVDGVFPAGRLAVFDCKRWDS